MRLDKFLSDMGIEKRSQIKKFLKTKQITVNDEVCTDRKLKIDENIDVVKYNGEIIIYRRKIYLMMNKKAGVISATKDRYKETVLDFLPEKYQNKGIFPMGRLDMDAEGLLILTNDGELSHEILSPKKHVEKEYYAKIKNRITKEKIQEIEQGIIIEGGYKCMPAKIQILTDTEIKLKIKEGKYHQVKLMIKSAGSEVIYLKRIKIGGLELDKNLKLGEYKELTESEIALLKSRK